MNAPMKMKAHMIRMASGGSVCAVVVATVALLASNQAQAGRQCGPAPEGKAALSATEFVSAMNLAESTVRALDASGAQVVVLARSGQDLSRWGQHWSHVGLAWRKQSAHDGVPGVWRVVHKLNDCGTDRADLFREGIGNFFMDRMHAYRAVFVPLHATVAARLMPVITDRAAVARWHTPAYSLVSHAWSQRYQQSNQWVLETLAGAMDGGRDGGTDEAEGGGKPDGIDHGGQDSVTARRWSAQRWLAAHRYRPDPVAIPAWKRIGALVTTHNVHFDDHPFRDRLDDRIVTVTADSVLAWLKAAGLGTTPVPVRQSAH